MKPTKQKTPTVEQLIHDCLHRKETACRALYDLYADRMFTMLLALTKDRDLAQDMLQEGFITVFERLRDLRTPTSAGLTAWIRRIMVNTAISTLRKQNVRHSINLSNDYAVEPAVEYNLDAYDIDIIMRAIDALPDAQRIVFRLHEVEGYSHAEIALMMGVDEVTIRSNNCRARQKLRDSLSSLSH